MRRSLESATDVVIVGAGGHGLVVLDILRAAAPARWRPVGFVDANPSLAGTTLASLPVFGHLNVLPKLRQQHSICHAIVAIGNNRVRRSYAAKLAAAGFEMISAVHRSAVISETATLGRNVVVAAGAIICTGVRIADSALINTGALIDHECEIGEGAHIASGARLAGRVAVGAGAFIGLGANVVQCLKVGEESTVGAGALVLRDVLPGMTVVGVPATRFLHRATPPISA